MFFHDWMSEPGNETSNEWLASSQEPPASWINLSLSNGKGKKCVREALQKFGEKLLSIMLKNNSLIKITGNMLDHNGKPVSFLQDFFFNVSVHYYIITCGTVYVSFSKFIWKQRASFVPDSVLVRMSWVMPLEQNLSGFSSLSLSMTTARWP